MPQLPSGTRLWLSAASILDPATGFLPSGQDRFWYRDVDPGTDWLPGEPGRPPECLRTATVPGDRIEAAAYVRVLIATSAEAEPTWRGDWLLTFERPDDFTLEDWEASLAFFGSPRSLDLLDAVIERCRRQAETGGTLEIEGFEPAMDGRPALAERLAIAVGNADRLVRRRGDSELTGEDDVVRRIDERLEAMYEFADRSLDVHGPHRAIAHRLLATLAYELGDREDAVRHARAHEILLPDGVAFSHRLIARAQQAETAGAVRLGPRVRGGPLERAGDV
ncbi:MAG: hypothetical protein GY728_14470 [Phycisphaeraceae bacterium]|nr:hypothetical protein [Phycisphaeraceae bacterium]MCP4497074.1 hypothetical protein [Phycisphaeraceae bacterium]MDG1359330.1 hypothetical protein [Phycisphaerales bacterium]MDG1979437.1 hypothetical protein [Phycisphaerales bacterium]